MEGLVFGMSNTAVRPPSTAARVPVGMLSTALLPGSRRCTCGSISPGSTCRPVVSNVFSAVASGPTPRATNRRRPTARREPRSESTAAASGSGRGLGGWASRRHPIPSATRRSRSCAAGCPEGSSPPNRSRRRSAARAPTIGRRIPTTGRWRSTTPPAAGSPSVAPDRRRPSSRTPSPPPARSPASIGRSRSTAGRTSTAACARRRTSTCSRAPCSRRRPAFSAC